MEPKTQLDFLIEEFFNTGKLNLNGKDEGITFDQLEKLVESRDLVNMDLIGNLQSSLKNANSEREKENYRDSLQYNKQALEFYYEMDDITKGLVPKDQGEGAIKNNITNIEQLITTQQSDPQFKKEKRLEKIKDIESKITSQLNISKRFEEEGKFKEAIDSNKKIDEIYKGLDGDIQSQITKFWVKIRDKIIIQNIRLKKEVNLAPIPELGVESVIEDDLFLRTLQNILLMHQWKILTDIEDQEAAAHEDPDIGTQHRTLLDIQKRYKEQLDLVTTLEKEREETIFGEKTEEAVKDYQQSKGLREDGIVNERIWNLLLSDEERIRRYNKQLSNINIDDLDRWVTADQYGELINTGEEETPLKKALSFHMGKFLYHIQNKNIYQGSGSVGQLPPSIEKLTTDYNKKKEEYTKEGIKKYKKERELAIDNWEDTKIGKLKNGNVYRYIRTVPYKERDQLELPTNEVAQSQLNAHIEYIRKKIEAEQKLIDTRISKAKRFNEKYLKMRGREDVGIQIYIQDRQSGPYAAWQQNTIGLYNKLFNAVEDQQKKGELPINEFTAAIAEINKTLKQGGLSRDQIYQSLKTILDNPKLQSADVIDAFTELKETGWGWYEDSFTSVGGDKGNNFQRPVDRGAESRLHNLSDGWLSKSIKSNTNRVETKTNSAGDKYDIQYLSDPNDITKYLKNNIEKYVNDDKNDIIKFDLIAGRDMAPLQMGDKVEVKKNKYSLDSYYSEPLASPMKSSKSVIRTDDNYREKYNQIIDGLYKWLNDKSNPLGMKILEKMIAGTAGILFDYNIFIPIKDLQFYISNKGQNSCENHRRITIRYRVKRNTVINIYKLKEINGSWGLERQPSTPIKDKGLKYCGENNEPKIIYTPPTPTNESIDKYISQALGF